MLLPQQKYKTAFKSLLVIIFCNFLIITKLATSVYGKIIFRVFMTGFQDFMLQKHSVQNIQPSQIFSNVEDVYVMIRSAFYRSYLL